MELSIDFKRSIGTRTNSGTRTGPEETRWSTTVRSWPSVFETTPLAISDSLEATIKAVPLRFSLPLDKVEPGRYDCQVAVLDPNGQKVAFWRAPVAPVVVVP
jgi:hypothetical protein